MVLIKDRINELSLDEKLKIIINDKKAEMELEGYGIKTKGFFNPSMNNTSLGLSVVRNSWNKDAAKLIGTLTAEDMNNEDERNIVTVPALALYSKNPDYFTSSPVLLGEMARSYHDGLSENGQVVAPRFYANELDNDNISLRMKKEIYLKPLRTLNSSPEFDGLYVYSSRLSNNSIPEITKAEGFNGCLIIEDDDPKNIIRRLSEGYSLVVTNKNIAIHIVKQAVRKYNESLDLVNQSIMSADDFEHSIKSYEIIDEKIIDERVASLLSYLSKNKAPDSKYGEGEKNVIYANTYAEASILLKNENRILPLKSEFEISFSGDIQGVFGEIQSFKEFFPNSTTVRGYDPLQIDDEKFNKEALNSIKKNGVAIVFLNVKDSKIPYNQIKYLEYLFMNNKPVIAIANQIPNDVTFEKYCKAVLVANSNVTFLSEIILGNLNPSGRLPKSLVSFDKGGEEVKFPFGHGLNYSTIEYSNLIINVKSIEMTVANRGSYPAYEVIELYIGLPNSSLRELKYFDKIHLEPGECKNVSIPLLFEFFEYYNEAKKSLEATLGKYTIYIGKSIKDAVFTATIDLNDRHELTIDEINDRLLESRDYLEAVQEDKRNNKPKEGSFLSYKAKKVLLIISTVYLNALFVAGIIISIFNKAQIGAYVMLGSFMFILNVALVLMFIFLYKSKHGKVDVTVSFDEVLNELKAPNFDAELQRREIERIKEEERRQKEEEERLKEEELRKQEEERLRLLEEEKKRRQALDDDEPDIIVNQVSVFNNSLNLASLVENLEKYLLENNIVIEHDNALAFISLLASTKSIIIHHEDETLALMFTKVVSSFFRQEHYVTDISTVNTLDDLLYKNNDMNKPTQFLKGIISANLNKDDFSFNVVDNVTKDNFKLLEPIKEYLNNPLKKNSIELKFIPTDLESSTLVITPNEYFLFIMKSDEDELTEEITKSSAYFELVARVELYEDKINSYDAVGYSQYMNLTNVFDESDVFISEDNWRKLDNVIDKINEYSYFKYNDIEFKKYEKFSLAYLLVDDNELAALDAIAHSFVIPNIPNLKKLMTPNNGIVDWFYDELGLDTVNLTSKAIKSIGK